jgi:hypothetical protein
MKFNAPIRNTVFLFAGVITCFPRLAKKADSLEGLGVTSSRKSKAPVYEKGEFRKGRQVNSTLSTRVFLHRD